jgi:hypothetical protein
MRWFAKRCCRLRLEDFALETAAWLWLSRLFFVVVEDAFLLGFCVVDVVNLWCSRGIWCGEDGQETGWFLEGCG